MQGAVGGIKGVTGGEADHGGGFAGGVMSFAEGLGSAVGIVASLYFTAGLGAKGVMGKGAAALGKAGKAGAAASKTLSITGKAGKFVLGAPLKATGYIGQGVGLVYKGAGAALKSVGFTKTGTLIAGKTGMAG